MPVTSNEFRKYTRTLVLKNGRDVLHPSFSLTVITLGKARVASMH
jgi:hypothetical protein